MQVTVAAKSPEQAKVDVLAIPLHQFDPESNKLPGRWASIDRALGGQWSAALRSGDFRAKSGQTLVLYPDDGIAAARVLLIGLGEEAKLTADSLRRAAGHAVRAASSRGGKEIALIAPSVRRVRGANAAQALAEGAVLASYRFDLYKEKPDDERPKAEAISLLFERAGDLRALRAGAAAGVKIAESQNLARDLSNEPANALPPAALAHAAQRMAREVGLRCQVLGVDALKKHKMEAILAVGSGSANSPRLIVLEHNRPSAKARSTRRRPTICLVGKGITFDSGGISIKPSAGMADMKHDMSGAAAVAGAMRAVALLNLPLHVVGVIGSAENMPSGTAYRPGDVVSSMSGKTIEVLNTDAEGRVVLADALYYAATQFDPDAVVDLATLTGACVVALGRWSSGLFGNDDTLVERIRRSGESTAERVWPMPLWDDHREHVKGQVGDVKNVGGRDAGASTAAAFLSHFVNGKPWAHLDIAATGWTEKATPIQSVGATGVGVRLLVDLLQNWKRL